MAECMKNGVTCPAFYKCQKEGLVANGAGWETVEVDGQTVIIARPAVARAENQLTMQQYCFYCLARPTGKKIGTVAGWTGSTPKWCPRGRGEDSKRCNLV